MARTEHSVKLTPHKARRATQKKGRRNLSSDRGALDALHRIQRSDKDYSEGLAQRIDSITEHQNIANLARLLQVSRNAIYRWSSGKSVPDVRHLLWLAGAVDVSFSWLLTGLGPMRAHDETPVGFVFPHSIHDSSVSFNVNSPIAFNATWMRDFERNVGGRLLIAPVADDAMEPTLKRGDLVLAIETGHALTGASEIGTSGLRLLRDGRVRRVHWQHDATVIVSCDNPLYRAETLTWKPGDPEIILGRIIWRGGRI